MPWTDREWGDRHAFFRELPEGLRPLLPDELRDFTYKAHGSLAQLYYDDPRVHYELWFHWRTGRIEIGLHFERDERTNALLFGSYDRHIVAIKAEIGDSIDLERWDKGWARIYETWPCEKVDRRFRALILERMARIISILEPIHQSAGRTAEPTLESAVERRR